MDPTLEKLFNQPLLDPLDETDLEYIRSIIHVRAYEPGEEVFLQGEEPLNFFLVSGGEFEVVYGDEEGEHRVNLLYPGEFFGDVALLTGERRGVTVRSVTESEALFLRKEDFLDLLDRYPELEIILNEQGHEIDERTRQTFEGQHEDEIVLYFERRHWLALVRRSVKIFILLLLWLLGMAAAYFILPEDPAIQTEVAAIGLVLLVIPLLWGIWEFVDWYNDFYILSNERVIHVEKVIGLLNRRYDAPLSKVQNVNVVQASPLNEILNYGKIVISTASQGNERSFITFDYLPNPHRMGERIIQELNREKSVIAEQEREQRRRAIRTALGYEPTTEIKANHANSPPPMEISYRSTLGKIVGQLLYFLIPITCERKNGTVIWRKHWVRLLIISTPAYLFFFSLTGFALAMSMWIELSGSWSAILWWVTGLLAIITFVAILLLYIDWRNDVYILTPDAILDEFERPFGFQKEVRRAPLDTIQDIRYAQDNPLMVWLNVGNVLIQTAGQQGEFTFDWVHKPREVQYDIFERMQALQELRRQAEVDAMNQELLELLKLYDEERDGGRLAPHQPSRPVDPSDPDATRRWMW